jgi:5-methylcytosine-specific restriction endonuclease McrA
MTAERRELPKGLRRQILAAYPTCVYCGRSYPITDHHMTGFSVDHVIPVDQLGTNDRQNLVGACKACNFAKGNRTPQQWAADILAMAEQHERELMLSPVMVD